MSCTFWGKGGVFFLVEITIFFKNAPITQFWLRKCEKVMFFWTLAQLRQSNGVFFGKIFSAIFSRFLMFFCGFFEVFCQISKKSMLRSFFDIFTDHKK